MVQHLNLNTVNLTSDQGGVEWHFVRNGLITSTVAYSLLRLCQGEIPQNAKFILDFIGINDSDAYAEIPDLTSLNRMGMRALKAMLKARCLPVTGNKEVLVQRLATASPEKIDPVADVMKCWWMKPITTSSMKLGKANENKVLLGLQAFLHADTQLLESDINENRLRNWHIETLVERGLLKSSNEDLDMLATSNDAIIDLRDLNHPECPIIAAVEIKTKTDRKTVEIARQIIVDHPDQNRCIVTEFGSEIHRALVPTPSYRCQTLHHVAVDNVNHVLYVLAQDSKIMYTVLAHISDHQRDTYARTVQSIAKKCVNHTKIDSLDVSELGHAVDHDTIYIWRKLKDELIRSRMSLTAAHELVPAAISMWNHVKGGQDVVSRQIKNVKVNFRRLHPRVYIWQHMINVSLLNAHIIIRLLKQECKLAAASSYRRWKIDLNKQASFESDFFIRVVTDWTPSSVNDICASSVDPISMNDGHAGGSVEDIKTLRKRKIEWWNKEAGRTMRLDRTVTHGTSSVSARSCVLCRTPSQSASAQRKGGFSQSNTTNECSVCHAALCVTTFGNRTSTCMSKFHAQKQLKVAERPAARVGKLGRLPKPSS